jgi:formylmethanofuran--tetrahydromethanopterin N-formyltransferase
MADIDDTYAEAFRSIFAEVLITARDRAWLDHAIHAATGNASSTILCDCEAGLDRYVGPAETPDRRNGAIVQFHVPRFRKDRVEAITKALLTRISQNVLTCATAACFNPGPSTPLSPVLGGEGMGVRGQTSDPTSSPPSPLPRVQGRGAEDSQPPKVQRIPLGRKLSYFGDGHQFRDVRHGRRVWVVPILGGEFVIERRFCWQDGLMGGNLWFMGRDLDSSLSAAERAVAAVREVSGVIMPFPGGIAASGSKAGSRYKFLFASTYAEYCPTLREKLGDQSRLPVGVGSVMEIIINGRDLATIAKATQAAIAASVNTPGLVRISAGNYGGRLGKSFIFLHPDKQPSR